MALVGFFEGELEESNVIVNVDLVRFVEMMASSLAV